jgi:hypothetical protein
LIGKECLSGLKNSRPVTGSHTLTTAPLQVATLFPVLRCFRWNACKVGA